MTPFPCYTLEVYNKTPIFSLVYIKEDVVESFMRKLLGSSGPGGTESEALQGWILNPGSTLKYFVLVLKMSPTGYPMVSQPELPIMNLCLAA